MKDFYFGDNNCYRMNATVDFSQNKRYRQQITLTSDRKRNKSHIKGLNSKLRINIRETKENALRKLKGCYYNVNVSV